MTNQESAPILGLEPRHLNRLSQLLQSWAPHAEVWAFGSLVKGQHHSGSDLDLVIRRGLPVEKLAELKSAFSESDLPFWVDLLHWDLIPEEFRQAIVARYVVVGRS